MFLLYRKPIFAKIGLSEEKRGNGAHSQGLLQNLNFKAVLCPSFNLSERRSALTVEVLQQSPMKLAYLFGLFRDFVLIMLFVIISHNSILAMNTEKLQCSKTGVSK